jgi:hypothetical protein
MDCFGRFSISLVGGLIDGLLDMVWSGPLEERYTTPREWSFVDLGLGVSTVRDFKLSSPFGVVASPPYGSWNGYGLCNVAHRLQLFCLMQGFVGSPSCAGIFVLFVIEAK